MTKREISEGRFWIKRVLFRAFFLAKKHETAKIKLSCPRALTVLHTSAACQGYTVIHPPLARISGIKRISCGGTWNSHIYWVSEMGVKR